MGVINWEKNILSTIDTNFEVARISNNNLLDSIELVNNLPKTIPSFILEKDNKFFDSNKHFKKIGKLTIKIQLLFDIRIEQLKSLTKLKSDPKLYTESVTKLNTIINLSKNSLDTDLDTVFNSFNKQTCNVSGENKKTVSDAFTAMRKAIEIAETSFKNLESLTLAYLERSNISNANTKLIQVTSFGLGTLTYGLSMGVAALITVPKIFSTAENVSKLCADTITEWTDLLGPDISCPSNRYVKCHFKAWSTGHQAKLLQPSRTHGVIIIHLKNEEEFWINFNLNLEPFVHLGLIHTIKKILLEEIEQKEMDKEEFTQITKELKELEIKGRVKEVKGDKLFASFFK